MQANESSQLKRRVTSMCIFIDYQAMSRNASLLARPELKVYATSLRSFFIRF